MGLINISKLFFIVVVSFSIILFTNQDFRIGSALSENIDDSQNGSGNGNGNGNSGNGDPLLELLGWYFGKQIERFHPDNKTEALARILPWFTAPAQNSILDYLRGTDAQPSPVENETSEAFSALDSKEIPNKFVLIPISLNNLNELFYVSAPPDMTRIEGVPLNSKDPIKRLNILTFPQTKRSEIIPPGNEGVQISPSLDLSARLALAATLGLAGWEIVKNTKTAVTIFEVATGAYEGGAALLSCLVIIPRQLIDELMGKNRLACLENIDERGCSFSVKDSYGKPIKISKNRKSNEYTISNDRKIFLMICDGSSSIPSCKIVEIDDRDSNKG